MASPQYVRKPYTGSCHCGLIKYIVCLTLPPPPPSSKLDLATFHKSSGLKIYKCNCTVCHKMGIFHLRLKSPPDDFVLLSPVAPTPDQEGSGVGAYACNAGLAKWYFCRTCGVRTFTVRGEKEVVEVALPSDLLGKSGEGTEKVAVWRVVKEGWDEHSEEGESYFSLNMTTIDAQQGLDLRRVQDWGVVEYCDSLFEEGDWAGVPYEGGMY